MTFGQRTRKVIRELLQGLLAHAQQAFSRSKAPAEG